MKHEISKRMDIVEQEIEQLFTNLYCKKDFQQFLKKIKDAQPDRRPSLINDFAEMLEAVGYKYEAGKPYSYYVKLIPTLDIPDNQKGVIERIVSTLNDIYVNYPKPSEFIERMVDSLDTETAFEKDPLQLRILKRFVSVVNVEEIGNKYSKTFANKNVSDIDESYFDVLNSKKECDYKALVQAANSLANGKFVSPVVTKEWLFWFAFAYGMKYYPSKDSDDYDVNKDVVKNLFEDYYCDNLTRYLYLEDGGTSGISDSEPSGIGLNFKNFVDVTFIYYLNLENMDASQKVSGFYYTIKKVRDAWNKKYEYIEIRKNEYEQRLTQTYKENFERVISNMDEETFKNYLLENYYCDLRYMYTVEKTGEIRKGAKGFFEFQIALNSPYGQYEEIIDLIKDSFGIPMNSGLGDKDNRTYKRVNTVFDVLDDYWFDSELDYFECHENSSKEFVCIIKNIVKRLNPHNALAVADPKDITRTKMIAAYYHYYCLENFHSKVTWRSFKEVYDDIYECLNDYLEKAGYQKISSKNLYDVFVIFFAYCKINNLLID